MQILSYAREDAWSATTPPERVWPVVRGTNSPSTADAHNKQAPKSVLSSGWNYLTADNASQLLNWCQANAQKITAGAYNITKKNV